MSKESFLCFIFQQLTKKSPAWGTMPITGVNDLTRDLFRSLDVFLPNCSIFSFFKKSNYIDHGVWNPEVDQREEHPLLPFGNPIGYVPTAGRGVC